jgi:hypothetical protein
LFVMGFAYQVFPRIRVTDGVGRRIANATLLLMVAGIAARSVGEPPHDFPVMRWTALAGAAAEIVASVKFMRAAVVWLGVSTTCSRPTV